MQRPMISAHHPNDPPSAETLERTARLLRRLIVDVSYKAQEGHIGSALSIADIMAVLWGGILHAPGTDEPDRDRFVLAKGHAALALHAVLYQAGLMSEDQLRSFCAEGSNVCAHPMHTVAGIELSTGSLGQGLSVACGRALALRRARSVSRVFVVMSDGECNEGQVWEAVMCGGHHALDNLQVVVDVNRSQCLGATNGILHVPRIAAAWDAFGWQVIRASGHDVRALWKALAQPTSERPRVVLADTLLGKGVSFMEGDFHWHYGVLSEEQHAMAMSELTDP